MLASQQASEVCSLPASRPMPPLDAVIPYLLMLHRPYCCGTLVPLQCALGTSAACKRGGSGQHPPEG